MAQTDFEVQVLSAEDYDDLIVDICDKKEFCCLLSQEQGLKALVLSIHPRKNQEPWSLPWAEFDSALREAADRLRDLSKVEIKKPLLERPRNWRPSICQLSHRYPMGQTDTVDVVSEVLRREDPLRLISDNRNIDEYFGEAQMIAARLSRCKSLDECRRMVFEVFRDQYGADSVSSEQSVERLAALIWDAIPHE